MYKTAPDHNTLRWVDDTRFVLNDSNYYQPWFSGDPDNLSHLCVRISGPGKGYTWGDRACSDIKWAICEKGGCFKH